MCRRRLYVREYVYLSLFPDHSRRRLRCRRRFYPCCFSRKCLEYSKNETTKYVLIITIFEEEGRRRNSDNNKLSRETKSRQKVENSWKSIMVKRHHLNVYIYSTFAVPAVPCKNEGNTLADVLRTYVRTPSSGFYRYTSRILSLRILVHSNVAVLIFTRYRNLEL